MLTRQQAAPMIRRRGRKMRQMHELKAENERLRAQVRWLRDALINETIRYRKRALGAMPTNEQIHVIIGGIDGNMAVAADRAVPHGGASEPTPDEGTHVVEQGEQ